MRTQVLFLLLYSGVLHIGIPCAAQSELCASSNGLPLLNCTAPPDPTADFLMCVGVPEGSGAGDLHVLKGLMEAVLDVYTFMHSVSGVPVLEMIGAVQLSWTSLLQNQDFLHFWLEFRLTPLLSTVSQQFLTCLSNSDFDCNTYHTVVQKLSQHYSGMDPERQKWIYMFFMYPFLSRNSSAGCVDPNGTTEDWLIKNFGSFSVLGQIKDFATINGYFSGLEVLHLLTPQQQADLLLNPELGGVNNISLSMVMDSLLNSVLPPGGGVNLTSNGSMWTTDIYLPSPQDPVTQVMNGFMTAFAPVRSFVREFVSLSHQPDLSSAMFVQGMLDWTLAELAAPYKQNSSTAQTDLFDPTNVNAWFTHVVTPVLQRFLPGDIPNDIISVFHALFYINTGANETTGPPDLCSITLEAPECALNNLMQDVVKVLQCADTTNLTLTPKTLETITLRLTTSLNLLLNQLANTNFSAPDSPFSDILDRYKNPSPSNLQDELFISTWFQNRLKPRLSHLDQNYLTCLSAKPFSCQTYQILVKGMSDNMFLIGEHEQLVYTFFITSFLQQQNSTAPCMNHSSSQWILRNLGGFSHLVSVPELYLLNKEFNALDALDVLTPRQIAQLVVEDLPVLPEKKQVIDAVFDFALVAPIERNLTEILHNIIILTEQMGMNCSSYQQILNRLYAATVPPEIQKIVHDAINTLSLNSPSDCLILPPATCLSIPVNESLICAGVYSVEQFNPLMNISCNTSLEQATCSQAVTGLTAQDLASFLTCSLSSNTTYYKETWKLLFTKLDGVLDNALRIFSSRALPWPVNNPSVSEMLDAVADVRLQQFSPDQWENVSVIANLFDNVLKPLLPFASADLLYCFSSKNFSCNTYHLLLKEFSDQMFLLDQMEKLRVLKGFILSYLTKNSTDVGCVFSTNGSSDWLLKNFGAFSELLAVRDLITINPLFDPMLVLSSLTPLQTAELMVENLPGLPEKSDTINTVFDFLRSSPWKLIQVIQELLMFSNKGMIPCNSHAVISNRLFWALTFIPQELEYQFSALADQLKLSAPQGCVLTPFPTCIITHVNETQLCEGFNRFSSEQLLQDLHNGSCSISLQNYACSQLYGFSSSDLALLLSCTVNSTEYPNEVWKLLFYKAYPILDQALLLFSNMTGNKPLPRSPAVANVLGIIAEVQLDRFTPVQWNDGALISTIFGNTLRPYLSSVRYIFLQCLVGKNLSCPTFQIIVQEFSQFFSYMDAPTVLSEFFLPVLLINSDMGCVSSTNGSSDWLVKNFGAFSELMTVRDLININPLFDPLLALSQLSPSQVAQVMLMDVPDHSTDEVINSVFDFLVESPETHRMPAVLNALTSSTEMIPCSSHKLIFTRLQLALLSVPAQVTPAIQSTFDLLLLRAPAGCLSSLLQCPVTLVNESEVCRNVDSSAVQSFLTTGGSIESLCRFPILNYSCADLHLLTELQLSSLLQCKLGSAEVSSKDVWKLFLTKVSAIMDGALYQLTRNTDSLKGQSVTVVLEVIAEMRLNQFTPDKWAEGGTISDWLNTHLKPFLPSVSGVFLYCLSSKNLTCSSYQTILPVFSQKFSSMDAVQAELVLQYFIKPFLTSNSTGGCVSINNAEWLSRNFGQFSQIITVNQLMNINKNFNPLDVLDMLNLGQLVEVLTSSGLISTSAQVNLLMNNVPDSQLYMFFTSLANTQQGVVLSGPVKVTLLQQVLDRVNLADLSVSQMQVWVDTILPPLIPAITQNQIPEFFTMFQNTPCNISQQAVLLLNSSSSSFSNDMLHNVYLEIINSLKGKDGLRCYGNQSFYSFLQSSFMSFQFPPLSVLLSIIPTDLQPQLLSSMSPAELYSYLSGPGAVDDPTQLCQVFDNYQSIGEYLQNEPVVSAAVGRQTLACVWSRALSASSQDEVDQWFNVRLGRYLPFLSSQLINSTQLSGASCLSYRKLVSVMGGYNYSNVDFTQQDVYIAIKDYLTTDFTPKCYNPADPLLNSTSWFVDYLGFFISFVSLEDLDAFGGLELQSFTLDMTNLKLFQQYSVNEDVMSAYVEMLYEVNKTFSASLLPGVLQCFAPAIGFTDLDSSASVTVLDSLETYCSNLDPTVSAALAENMGSVTSSSISALGNSSTGLSTGQISSASPAILSSSLSVLSNVIGWSQAQTLTIVHTLLNSGVFKITSSSSLLQLGTLVTGVPSTVFTTVQPTELLKAVQSASFLTSITNAPSVTQQTIVYQLITLDSSSDAVVNMIPGSLATLIPRNSLLSVSTSSAATINKKQWKYEQAMLFFDAVAGAITDEDSISATVMQGFTSTRVQSFTVQKVHKLIKGCRRRNNFRIILQESQLTCMYNYIQWTAVTNFTNYPPELLLYYDYSLINQSLCQDYFSALGFADFTVLSSDMSFRKQILLNNAFQCLKISGTKLTRAQLEVLGNLTCFLGSSYILDSDPYVLEKLKPCQSFSKDQISAIETVLLTKNTEYGAPVNWTISTLNKLGGLPLYFTSNIWVYFTLKDKAQFLKTFLPPLRENLKFNKDKIISLMNEAQKMSKTKTRLSHRIKRDTACTAGDITQVQANDNSFPFGYDVTQFNVCLSVQTLKDNLAAISQKVVGSEYQRVILDKLNQAYPSGISDEILQVLGPASRAATVTDISKWNITKVDTLSALMKSSDGNWTSDQVKAVVSRYLVVGGNSLGRSELNALGGVNLCALDISTLNTITSTNLQSAGSLSVSTCSLDQKQVLFSVAQTAFSDKTLNTPRASTPVSTNAYQLIQTYLGGASLAYVQNLAASNISMDMPTFLSLNPAVINALTVSEVKALLGNANLADLKRYENNTVVQNWVRLQPQVQLDALAIGLTGGTASNSTTAAPATSNATTANAIAATATTGSGSRVQALPRLQLLVLLWVVMATLKLMH
ncbi:uncharacterized protein LOC103033028 isoform X6 [Astyanax mexicanus]|uniref:uncharacterized protein LOC103033028 isoform X2 n=1 Tax=Astyanax mexicanus TaxID=7994 RepID=UPI0020CB5750|nr:uncharacterized protein LOC103033028 isoform X2 [Astyanax mexicanus]XP_049325325.1 uncharacterized protein LOC103033028 isoform X4 [Astyanax mexicanus]XP_049325326.1 uncharacterized protein LOC103033028 isoform X5 [Astyanax mexicanus]XP_049325327.1 uncharacterized protein LOC103033028 isoform X6 [Astyanax mexicanus]